MGAGCVSLNTGFLESPGIITQPPSGCWEPNQGPLEKQPVILPSEQSLQPNRKVFNGDFTFLAYKGLTSTIYFRFNIMVSIHEMRMEMVLHADDQDIPHCEKRHMTIGGTEVTVLPHKHHALYTLSPWGTLNKIRIFLSKPSWSQASLSLSSPNFPSLYFSLNAYILSLTFIGKRVEMCIHLYTFAHINMLSLNSDTMTRSKSPMHWDLNSASFF